MVSLISEVRKLLTGRYHIVDGIIIAYEDNTVRNLIGWQGLPTGGGNAIVMGITAEAYEYGFDDAKVDNPLEEVLKILMRYARLTALASNADAVGFLQNSVSLGNFLYVIEETLYGRLKVTVYTSRSATSSLCIKRAFKQLEDELPEGFFKYDAEDEITLNKKEKKNKKKGQDNGEDEDDTKPADDFDL